MTSTMTGRLRDLYYDRDGRQVVVLEIREDMREAFDALKDGEVAVDIRKQMKRRSLDANAYAWVLIGKLAEALSKSKAEIYRETIRDIGGASEILCIQNPAVDTFCAAWSHQGLGWQTETFPSKIPGCTNVTVYYGSSVYDTKQMSLLIDRLVQDCESIGIPTLTDETVEKMLARWDRKER